MKLSFKLWLEAWQEPNTVFYLQLKALRPQFAQAAQKVYDAWDQSSEYDELNGGGICHLIAEAIADVIYSANLDVESGTVSAQCGEQHVWVVVHNRDDEGYAIDIPYSTYETGGGYTWQKIQGVKFDPDHIIIDPMHIDDAKASFEDY